MLSPTPPERTTAIRQVLKKHWGFDAFRPLQEDIILSVLAGQDTLALMPTGGGKSLCYQVPGLAMEGICLVISPLIALMKDQVENLKRKNITAFSIYSGMSWKEVRNTLKTVSESNCKFLYVSPERLETALFLEYLPGMDIRLIAVDEAHCISQWGYDFRPSYLKIAALREELPGVPVLALTASATPEVQWDICERLNAEVSVAGHQMDAKPQVKHSKKSLENRMEVGIDPQGWRVFRQSFERANLSYSVFRVDAKINKIIEILQNVPGTGIVYCKSRKRTREVSELLQLQNISADYYHAGLTQEERNRKQEAWINNEIRVIVCTNAFGMGIDKPDVRTVVHADLPDCLENYYQEAGRAGRDGKKSYAVLLYDDIAIEELKALVGQRFPSQKEVREVYQAVANFLQIPTGMGQGEYYDFDFLDFTRKFKFRSHTALYSLKVLEQEGWLAFNEQVFLPPTIMFTVTKDYLHAFQRDNKRLEPLIKGLLRAYEGVFDQPAFVSELVIAQLLKKDIVEIKTQLGELSAAGIIEYKPRKDSPQLLLMRNRVKAEEIELDMLAYNQRKDRLTRRINEMTGYVAEETRCRSQLIASYFGDNAVKSCGICDNCLRRKTTKLSEAEFIEIRSRIDELLKDGALSIKDLLLGLRSFGKEKSWQVIDLLQAEQQLVLDKNGRVNRGK